MTFVTFSKRSNQYNKYMENPIVQKIWFEIKNMKGQDWGYDGMKGEDGDYVERESVLAIIDKYLRFIDSSLGDDHLLNILKIISVDDYEEETSEKVHNYLESRKILNVRCGSIHPQTLDSLNKLLSETQLVKCEPGSEFQYERVTGSPIKVK